MQVTAIQNFRQSGALLDKAVKRLAQGGWLALPSECGYRIVVRGDHAGAIQNCLASLGNPSQRPWGLLVEERSFAEECCELQKEEKALADFFWPGPLVLISKLRTDCGLELDLPMRKLAIRCSNHPLIVEIVKRCRFPLLCRGLRDRHQRVYTDAAALASEFSGGEVMEANAPCLDLMSTVLEMSPQGARLLRRGFITMLELRLTLPKPFPIILSDEERGARRRDQLTPQINLQVVEGDPARVARRLKSLLDSYPEPPLLLLSQETSEILGQGRVLGSRESDDYAEQLQRVLQEIQSKGGEPIVLVEGPVRVGRGAIVMERLEHVARHLVNTEDPGYGLNR